MVSAGVNDFEAYSLNAEHMANRTTYLGVADEECRGEELTHRIASGLLHRVPGYALSTMKTPSTVGSLSSAMACHVLFVIIPLFSPKN